MSQMVLILSLIFIVTINFVTTARPNKTFIKALMKYENPHRIQKRECAPKVTLKQCSKRKVNKRYTYYLYYQYSNIRLQCAAGKLSDITWELKNLDSGEKFNTDQFKFKRTYIIKPNQIEAGRWKISLSVSEFGGTSTDSCELVFENEVPVIQFENGLYRYVSPRESFKIDLSKSTYPTKQPFSPSYTFYCKPKRGILCPPCPQPKDNSLVISYYADPCYESITTEVIVDQDGLKVKAVQKATIMGIFDTHARIDCIKNCGDLKSEYSNPELPITLQLVCVKKCLLFKSKRPEWMYFKEVNQMIAFQPNQIQIVDNSQIIIRNNVFKYNESVFVTAKVPNSYETIRALRMNVKFPIINCEITPKEGESLVTNFKIVCETSHLAATPFFEVYRALKNHHMYLLESPNEEMEVVIGVKRRQEEQQLVIKARNIFDQEIQCKVDKITVRSKARSLGEYQKFLTKIERYRSSGKDQLAFQAIQAMYIDLTNSKLSKEKSAEIDLKLLENLDRLNIDNIYIYKQILSTLGMFYAKSNMSEEYNQKLSEVCKKISTIKVSSLLKPKYSAYLYKEIASYARNLMKCADELLKVTNAESSINETTPILLLTEPEVTEDYPNYEMMFENRNLDKIRLSSINGILESSKKIAMALGNGEITHIKQNKSEVLVAVDTGENFVNKTIDIGKVRIVPSTDFAKNGMNSIGTMVSLYKNDVLGYGGRDIITNIINLGFYSLNNTIPLSLEEHRFDIIFDVIVENGDIDYIRSQVCVPSNPLNWKTPDINYYMNIHRMNVRIGMKCSVMFVFMKQSEKLQIVLTKNRRPSIKDFRKGMYVVDGSVETSQTVSCPFYDDSFDYFGYLGVLPHPDMLENPIDETSCVEYSVYMTSTQCVTYNELIYDWVFSGCFVNFLPNTNASKIKCSCNHTTTFAAKRETLINKMDFVQNIPVNGRMEANLVILGHVAFVFFCYCLAILLASLLNSKIKSDVYFLSDNLKNDKYAYAILIKTGSYPGSGTTSNICIKIFGEKASSHAHVLNYPDPERKILQYNKLDWFVLTNGVHLGNLKYILIWFDSIGLRPSWFCENIKIIDLQTDQIWFFNVEAWLDVRNENSIQLKVDASEKQAKIKVTLKNYYIRRYIHSYFGKEHTWNIFKKGLDDELSLIERLTIMLSIIYTTYSILLLIIGRPTMTSRDAYGYGRLKFYNEIFYLPFVSSILAGSINFPFLFMIRNSEKVVGSTFLITEKKRFSTQTGKITSILLYSWIFVCMIYLLTFGYFVSYNSIYVWMITTILSILISIFLLENIYLIVLNIVENNFGKVKMKIYNTKKIIQDIEKQRRFLFGRFGELLMRPYFQRHYYILRKADILRLKKKLTLRVEMSDLFHNMCVFIIYIIFLYIICFLNSSSSLRKSNREITKMIENEYYTGYRAVPLNSIDRTKRMYDYINKTIILITHPVNWYGNYNSLNPGLMIDFSTKILGIVQLRQQRMVQLCNSSSALIFNNILCPEESPTKKTWKYDNGSKITVTLGELKMYSGKGYIATLGRNLYNSHFVLEFLFKNKWIDFNTKVLFIEFWTYNVNSNVFNAVRILIERDLSGYILTSYKIFTGKFIDAGFIKRILFITSIIVLVVTILIFIINRLIGIMKKRQKRKYLTSLWNVFDILILILSTVLIYLYFYKAELTGRLLNKLMDSRNNEFVKFFNLVSVARMKILVSAILVCLATIRLWQFLRFGTVFRIMERTLWKSLGALMLLMSYQIIVFVMFGVIFFVIYGSYLKPFRSFTRTLITLFLSSLGIFAEIDFSHMGIMFNCIYLIYLISTVIFLTFYAAVLMIAYEEASNYFSNKETSYNLKSYIIEESKFRGKLFGIWLRGKRLKGGQDGKVKDSCAYPKEDCQRYADSVMISQKKLDVMKFVALCAIRKSNRNLKQNFDLTEHDYKLMAKLFILFGKRGGDSESENRNHIFFKAQDPDDEDKIKLVPDSRLLEMERVLNNLCHHEIEEEIIQEEVVKPVIVSGDSLRMKYFVDILRTITEAIENIKIRVKK